MWGVSTTHKQFMMCDNGYNTLSTPSVFEGMRYRPWIHGAWEEYQGTSMPDTRRQVLLLAYARYKGEDGHHPESPRVLRVARALVGGETQSVARQCLRRRVGTVERDPPVTAGPRMPLVAATP